MRADGLHPDPLKCFGRGDQRVRHGPGGQVDHEIVDGVALAAFHHVQRQDVRTHQTQRHGQRPEGAGPVLEFHPQQIRTHAPTVAQGAAAGMSAMAPIHPIPLRW